MIDLSQYDTTEAANAGARMQLYTPDGRAAEGCAVYLRGLDSDVARKQQRARQQDAIDRAASARSTGQMPRLLADDLAERTIDEMVELTVRFEGVQHEGQDVGDDPELIRACYQRYQWLFDQARAFIEDRAHFFPSASGN